MQENIINKLSILGGVSQSNKELYSAVNALPDDAVVARVAEEFRGIYKVFLRNSQNERYCSLAEVKGKRMFDAGNREDFPVVGDWVVVSDQDGEHLVIEEILPRHSVFKRKISDEGKEQIIATNIDLVFIVQPVNSVLSVERTKRIIMAVKASGAKVVLLFSKCDLDTLNKYKKIWADEFADDVTSFEYSVLNGKGLNKIKQLLNKDITACVVGESGAGKSTLINNFMTQGFLRTGAVREKDGKGRHTTTNRQMVFLANGAVLIDTPGIREFLWTDVAAEIEWEKIKTTIDELAVNCYFGDCAHENEPKCAVKQAVSERRISENMYTQYLAIKKEIEEQKKNNVAMQKEAAKTAMSKREKKKLWGQKSKGN